MPGFRFTRDRFTRATLCGSNFRESLIAKRWGATNVNQRGVLSTQACFHQEARAPTHEESIKSHGRVLPSKVHGLIDADDRSRSLFLRCLPNILVINADECTSAAYRLAAGASKKRPPAEESSPELPTVHPGEPEIKS